MSIGLKVLDGGMRARLSEDEWRGLYDVAETPEESSGPLDPLGDTASTVSEFDEGLVAGAELALGKGVVRIDVTTMSVDRGLVAKLGSDGHAAAASVRVIAALSEDAPATPVPGVEVSVVHAEDLVREVMRLFPPDGPIKTSGGGEAVTLPQEQALVLAKAIREDNSRLASEVASQCGWSEVPEVLISLAQDIRANAALAISVVGSDSIVLRRWLQCDLGWVSMAVLDGQITHRVCTRDDIRDDLTYALTGAFEFAFAGVSGRG